MRQRFVDYFELGDLDPDNSREQNYERLVEEHRKAGMRKGERGRTDAMLLTEAMAVFRDPAKYREYRAAWDRRQHRETRSEPPPETTTGPSGDDQANSAETAKGGLWSVLGTAALKALNTYVESKESQGTADRAGQLPPQADSPRSSLTGRWNDGSTFPFYIEQQGNRVVLQQRDVLGNIYFLGEGVVDRRTIQFVGRNGMGHDARGVLQVARNGKVIQGQVTWSQFNVPLRTSPVRLVRS